MGMRDGRPMWTGRYTPDYLRPKHVDLPKPDAKAIAQRPHLSPEVNRSNNRIDELDAQNAWLAHIAACRIEVR